VSVTLVPLSQNDLPRVAHLRVAPDQIRFSGTVAEAFATQEPNVDFHAIMSGTTAVGFFKIDRAYPDRYPFAFHGDLGLRAFLIDLAHQGAGLGAQACHALPPYLQTRYSNAKSLFLTVNVINLAAVRAYANGGFMDTGEIWPHGNAGPQHVLRLGLIT
jgi:RimJ/RimL family protein N-acetyltransferase